MLDFVLGEDKLSFNVSSKLAQMEIDDWLAFDQNGDNTILSMDLDGDGDFSNAFAFVELQNVQVTALSDMDITVLS